MNEYRDGKMNYIIIRNGSKSLHHHFFRLDPKEYCVVCVPYEDADNRYGHIVVPRPEDLGKEGKWPGLYRAVLYLEEMIGLGGNDFFWFPDDDVFIENQAVEQLFDQMKRDGLALCQPSLSEESFVSWPITMRVSGSYMRITNFVEVMAPCFTYKLMKEVYKIFRESHSGWGFEWLWTKVVDRNGLRQGIYDNIQMHHTQPLGKNLRSKLKGTFASPEEEMEALRKAYDLTYVPPLELMRFKSAIKSS